MMAMKFQDSVRSRRRRICLVVFLLMVLYVPLHYNLLVANVTLLEWGSTSTKFVGCYYSTLGDVLPSADDFSPSANAIFFHETSCVGNLTSRQACSIESAAREHLDYQVYVLFTGPLTEAAFSDNPFTMLRIFKNVRFARIHLDEYSKGTPVEQVVIGGALNASQWRISHTSDVLRYLTLYKWGGIYLDLDVVVAKRFDTLASSWSARESDTDVAAGAIAFARDKIGREVAVAAVREIQTNFRGDSWGHNGPGVITRVLKRMCTTTNVTLMSAATCKGFEVYGPELFYPIEWQNREEYFVAGKLKNEKAYVYHVWNQLTKNMKVHANSPYAELARRYCPSTYELYGDQFGT